MMRMLVLLVLVDFSLGCAAVSPALTLGATAVGIAGRESGPQTPRWYSIILGRPAEEQKASATEIFVTPDTPPDTPNVP